MLRANRGFSREAISALPLRIRAGRGLPPTRQPVASLRLAQLASHNLDQLRASLVQRLVQQSLAARVRIRPAQPGLHRLPALLVRSLVGDRSSALPARTSLNPSRKSTERTTTTNGISCTIRAWSSRTCLRELRAQAEPTILLAGTPRD